jgi:hypothetical protein
LGSNERLFDAQTAGRRGSHCGGHLYIQANEIHNAITYYRRSHDGTIAEDERIPAGGAGSGYSSPSADRVQPRAQARGGEAGEGSGGVAVAQAARNFDLHENVLRKWIREASADPEHAFPGHGQMRPEQFKINRLHREVTNLKALLQP